MTDLERLNKLNAQIASDKDELDLLRRQEKILASQAKELTRRERTHRLCTRGGMLESFLRKPDAVTDAEVMELLILAFRNPEVQARLNKLLERNP